MALQLSNIKNHPTKKYHIPDNSNPQQNCCENHSLPLTIWSQASTTVNTLSCWENRRLTLEIDSYHICMTAVSAGMVNFLGHVVLIAWSGVQCQEDMNKCLCNAVTPDTAKSSQWLIQKRTGHKKIMPKQREKQGVYSYRTVPRGTLKQSSDIVKGVLGKLSATHSPQSH
jgi:hypothetical protein